MSKVLTAAAIVVGAVAAVIAAPIAAAGFAIGGIAGAVAAVGSEGLLLTGALEVGALGAFTAIEQALAPVGHDGGTQVDFMANPQAGVPYAIGRTGTAGNIVMVDSAGTNSAFLSYATVYSLGPIQAYESFQANTISVIFDADNGEGAGHQNPTTTALQPVAPGATTIQVGTTAGFGTTAGTGISASITISGGGNSETRTLTRVDQSPKELSWSGGLTHSYPQFAEVTGASETSGFLNRMWLKTQLGGADEPYLHFTSTDSKDTPANHSGNPTVWTSSCQLSGLAASFWTLEYDAQVYSGGTPRPLQVVRGVFVYDPRQDSTYPGGSGACRSPDETTWIWSENPYLHALTWLIGRTSNGVKTMGVHAPIAAIDVAAYVNGANVADANGWKAGGVVYSTDGKWDVLGSMLQAGSGIPLKLGAKISCFVNAPLVSLDTLTGSEVVGKASIPTTTASRDRINAIWPRYREEQLSWQIVPTLAAVIVSDYVTADAGQRTKEIEYTLCQSSDQVATLARYDIENAREIQPISLTCKPRWMGYKPGDCITINEPEYGLVNQTVLILSREVDPATLVTTLTFRTETAGKHAFALGETASPPTTPNIQGFDPSVFLGPAAGAWSATGGVISSGGQTVPVINVVGAVDNQLAASIIVEYSLAGVEDWTAWTEANPATTAIQVTGLAPATEYDVGIRYRSVKGVISGRTVISASGGVETGGLAAGSAAAAPWTGIYGAGKPADDATVGAVTGTNLLSGTNGEVLTDAQVVTSQGTSANTAKVGTQSASSVIADLVTAASNVAALQSQYGDQSTQIANAEAELASQATTILTLQSDDAANSSALTEEVNNRTTADDSLSGRIDTSVANFNGLQSTYNATQVTQASENASLSSATTTLSARTSGSWPNKIVNGDFSQGTDYWFVGPGASAWHIYDDPQVGYYLNSSAATGYFYQDFPATPGQVFVGGAEGDWGLGGGFFYIQALPASENTNLLATAVVYTVGWGQRVWTTPLTCPANTAFIRLVVQMPTNATAGISRLGVNGGGVQQQFNDPSTLAQTNATIVANAVTAESATAAVASEQTTLSAQLGAVSANVATNEGAIATLDGKNAAYLIQSVNAGTGNASVSIESDGVTGIIELVAQILSIANPGGNPIPALLVESGLVYIANQLKVGSFVTIDPVVGGFVVDNGSIKLILAEPFGASANLILWVGPSGTAASACTTGNAYVYITTAGVFAGSGIASAASSGALAINDGSPPALNTSYQTVATLQFGAKPIPAGAYWTSLGGDINVVSSTNPLGSGLNGTIDWQILEAPHGTTSYSVIASGSISGTWSNTDHVWTFTASQNAVGTFGLSMPKACANSGSVDVVLQLAMGSGASFTGFQAGLAGSWSPGG